MIEPNEIKSENADERKYIPSFVYREAILAKLGIMAIMMFFIFIAIAMISGCAGINIRLPDRDHPNCKIPWEQRRVCISGADCVEGFECAKRGSSIGRCTYLDCCDPWRNGRLNMGDDFCGPINKHTIDDAAPCSDDLQ